MLGYKPTKVSDKIRSELMTFSLISLQCVQIYANHPFIVFFINTIYLIAVHIPKVRERPWFSFFLADVKLHIFGINGGKAVKLNGALNWNSEGTLRKGKWSITHVLKDPERLGKVRLWGKVKQVRRAYLIWKRAGWTEPRGLRLRQFCSGFPDNLDLGWHSRARKGNNHLPPVKNTREHFWPILSSPHFLDLMYFLIPTCLGYLGYH